MADGQAKSDSKAAKFQQKLASCFARAERALVLEKNYDYAHALLAECVSNAPANLMYVEALFKNLRAKFPHPIKKPALTGAAAKEFKQAVKDNEWGQAIRSGAVALANNPWDVALLRSLAEVCAKLHYNEVELVYLKQALDSNPKDPDVNRHCALSLTRMGQFDQAIACWHRIELLKPKSLEAARMIAELSAEKLKYPNGRPSTASKSEATAMASGTANVSMSEGGQELILSPRAALEKSIAADPRNVTNYLELTELLVTDNRLAEAETVLSRGLANCGESTELREKLRDVQRLRVEGALAATDANRTRAERLRPRVPWLELALLAAGFILGLQLLPGMRAALWSVIDVRRWSRAQWFLLNIAFVLALIMARVLPEFLAKRKAKRPHAVAESPVRH